MAVYNPPIASLDIFNPEDFNTVESTGSGSAVIQNKIVIQGNTVDSLTTTIDQLYSTTTAGILPINNIMYKSTTDRGPYNLNQIYSINVTPNGFTAGTYLITLSMSAVFNLTNSGTNTPTITYAISGIGNGDNPQYNYVNVGLASKSLPLGGLFIATFTNVTNIGLTWYVGSTTSGTYYFSPDVYAADNTAATLSAVFIKLK